MKICLKNCFSFQVDVVQGNLHAARHLLQVPPDGRLVGHSVLIVALFTGVLLALTVFTVSAVLAVMLGSEPHTLITKMTEAFGANSNR